MSKDERKARKHVFESGGRVVGGVLKGATEGKGRAVERVGAAIGDTVEAAGAVTGKTLDFVAGNAARLAKSASGDSPLVLPLDRDALARAPRLAPFSGESTDHRTWGLKGGPRAALNAALHGTVPAMEGIYALSLIDDQALEAFSFAAAGDPTFRELVGQANTVAAAEGASHAGSIARLAGYVAERRVATDLLERGAVVEFPSDPNQPGYDLLVDGSPIQVKCVKDPSAVVEHLERYPDIPVITNVEMATHFEGVERVVIDENLSHAEVFDATAESVHGLDMMDELGDFVPLLSLTIAAVRHGRGVLTGTTAPMEAAKRVALQGGIVGGLARLGSFAGGAVGLFLGPVGAVAGAVVGTAVGSAAGQVGADRIIYRSLHRACAEAEEALVSYGQWMTMVVLPSRLEALHRRQVRVAEACAALRPGTPAARAAEWMNEEFADNRRRTGQALDNLNRLSTSTESEDCIQAGWIAASYSSHVFHPDLARMSAALDSTIQNYLAEHDRFERPKEV